MSNNGQKKGKPPLAKAAGAIGFLLTAGLIGFVGWEAVSHAQADTPWVEVRPGKAYETRGGFVLQFEARNMTAHTAAGVVVEATLGSTGTTPIVSSVTLDYVPGHSVRLGGVFLPVDPRSGELKLRALGYLQP